MRRMTGDCGTMLLLLVTAAAVHLISGAEVLRSLPEPMLPPSAALLPVAPRLGIDRFVHLWELAELQRDLKQTDVTGSYTIFAPSDENIPDYLMMILNNTNDLQDFLYHHMAPGYVSVNVTSSIVNLAGSKLRLSRSANDTFVNGAILTGQEFHLPSRSIVHVIKGILCCNKSEQLNLPKNQTIVDILPTVHGSTFRSLLKQTDCDSSLDPPGVYTVFVPTDAAFARLDPFYMEEMRSNYWRLRSVLLYHVVPGRFPSSELINGRRILTKMGNVMFPNVHYTNENQTIISVAGFKILHSDIIGQNGIVHVIDRVVTDIPEGNTYDTLSRKKEFSEFLNLIERHNLIHIIRGKHPFTVFVPTNDVVKNFSAVQRRPAHLLKFFIIGSHYLVSLMSLEYIDSIGGSRISIRFVNESLIVGGVPLKKEILTRNGVIHPIEQLLEMVPLPPMTTTSPPAIHGLPPYHRSTLRPPYSGTSLLAVGKPTGLATVLDVIQVVLQRVNPLRTLVTSLLVTTIGQDLRTRGPFTVFAPIDMAFKLLNPPFFVMLITNNTFVRELLYNHLVPGNYTCADMARRNSLTTIRGQVLKLQPFNGCALVNGAKIIQPDVMASNGIIHVVDHLVWPGSVPAEVPDTPDVSDRLIRLDGNTMADLLNKAGLLPLLQQGTHTIFSPTDEAWNRLPPDVRQEMEWNLPSLRELLLFHLVPRQLTVVDMKDGEALNTSISLPLYPRIIEKEFTQLVIVGGATILKADEPFNNGLIHVIDKILHPLPYGDVITTLASSRDPVQRIIAILQMNLILLPVRPFTIFCPLDKAFDFLNIPLDRLLQENSTILTEIVNNHIVEGVHYLAEFDDETQLSTLNGERLRFKLTADGVYVNGVPIITGDILCTNGVIHIIPYFTITISQIGVGTGTPDYHLPKITEEPHLHTGYISTAEPFTAKTTEGIYGETEVTGIELSTIEEEKQTATDASQIATKTESAEGLDKQTDVRINVTTELYTTEELFISNETIMPKEFTGEYDYSSTSTDEGKQTSKSFDNITTYITASDIQKDITRETENATTEVDVGKITEIYEKSTEYSTTEGEYINATTETLLRVTDEIDNVTSKLTSSTDIVNITSEITEVYPEKNVTVPVEYITSITEETHAREYENVTGYTEEELTTIEYDNVTRIEAETTETRETPTEFNITETEEPHITEETTRKPKYFTGEYSTTEGEYVNATTETSTGVTEEIENVTSELTISTDIVNITSEITEVYPEKNVTVPVEYITSITEETHAREYENVTGYTEEELTTIEYDNVTRIDAETTEPRETPTEFNITETEEPHITEETTRKPKYFTGEYSTTEGEYVNATTETSTGVTEEIENVTSELTISTDIVNITSEITEVYPEKNVTVPVEYITSITEETHAREYENVTGYTEEELTTIEYDNVTRIDAETTEPRETPTEFNITETEEPHITEETTRKPKYFTGEYSTTEGEYVNATTETSTGVTEEIENVTSELTISTDIVNITSEITEVYPEKNVTVPVEYITSITEETHAREYENVTGYTEEELTTIEYDNVTRIEAETTEPRETHTEFNITETEEPHITEETTRKPKYFTGEYSTTEGEYVNATTETSTGVTEEIENVTSELTISTDIVNITSEITEVYPEKNVTVPVEYITSITEETHAREYENVTGYTEEELTTIEYDNVTRIEAETTEPRETPTEFNITETEKPHITEETTRKPKYFTGEYSTTEGEYVNATTETSTGVTEEIDNITSELTISTDIVNITSEITEVYPEKNVTVPVEYITSITEETHAREYENVTGYTEEELTTIEYDNVTRIEAETTEPRETPTEFNITETEKPHITEETTRKPKYFTGEYSTTEGEYVNATTETSTGVTEEIDNVTSELTISIDIVNITSEITEVYPEKNMTVPVEYITGITEETHAREYENVTGYTEEELTTIEYDNVTRIEAETTETRETSTEFNITDTEVYPEKNVTGVYITEYITETSSVIDLSKNITSYEHSTPSEETETYEKKNITDSYSTVTSVSFIPDKVTSSPGVYENVSTEFTIPEDKNTTESDEKPTSEISIPEVSVVEVDKTTVGYENVTDEFTTLAEEDVTSKYENVTTKESTEEEEIITTIPDEYLTIKTVTTEADSYVTDESRAINDTTRKPKYFTGDYKETSEIISHEIEDVTTESGAVVSLIPEVNITFVPDYYENASLEVTTPEVLKNISLPEKIFTPPIIIPEYTFSDITGTVIVDHISTEQVTLYEDKYTTITHENITKNETAEYEITPKTIPDEEITTEFFITELDQYATSEVTKKVKNITEEYEIVYNATITPSTETKMTDKSILPIDEVTTIETETEITGIHENITKEKEEFPVTIKEEPPTESVYITDESHLYNDTRKPKYFTGEYEITFEPYLNLTANRTTTEIEGTVTESSIPDEERNVTTEQLITKGLFTSEETESITDHYFTTETLPAITKATFPEYENISSEITEIIIGKNITDSYDLILNVTSTPEKKKIVTSIYENATTEVGVSEIVKNITESYEITEVYEEENVTASDEYISSITEETHAREYENVTGYTEEELTTIEYDNVTRIEAETTETRETPTEFNITETEKPHITEETTRKPKYFTGEYSTTEGEYVNATTETSTGVTEEIGNVTSELTISTDIVNITSEITEVYPEKNVTVPIEYITGITEETHAREYENVTGYTEEELTTIEYDNVTRIEAETTETRETPTEFNITETEEPHITEETTRKPKYFTGEYSTTEGEYVNATTETSTGVTEEIDNVTSELTISTDIVNITSEITEVYLEKNVTVPVEYITGITEETHAREYENVTGYTEEELTTIEYDNVTRIEAETTETRETPTEFNITETEEPHITEETTRKPKYFTGEYSTTEGEYVNATTETSTGVTEEIGNVTSELTISTDIVNITSEITEVYPEKNVTVPVEYITGITEETHAREYENVTGYTEEELTTIEYDNVTRIEAETTETRETSTEFNITETEEPHIMEETTRKPKYFTGEYSTTEGEYVNATTEISTGVTEEIDNVTSELTISTDIVNIKSEITEVYPEKNVTIPVEYITSITEETHAREYENVTGYTEEELTTIEYDNVTRIEAETTETKETPAEFNITDTEVYPEKNVTGVYITEYITETSSVIDLSKNITSYEHSTPSEETETYEKKNITDSYSTVTSVSFIPDKVTSSPGVYENVSTEFTIPEDKNTTEPDEKPTSEISIPEVSVVEVDKTTVGYENVTDEFTTLAEEDVTSKYENVTTKESTEEEEIITTIPDEYLTIKTVTTEADSYVTDESRAINETTRKPKYFTGDYEKSSIPFEEEENVTSKITLTEVEKNVTEEIEKVTTEFVIPAEKVNITKTFEDVTEISSTSDISKDFTKEYESTLFETSYPTEMTQTTFIYENLTETDEYISKNFTKNVTLYVTKEYEAVNATDEYLTFITHLPDVEINATLSTETVSAIPLENVTEIKVSTSEEITEETKHETEHTILDIETSSPSYYENVSTEFTIPDIVKNISGVYETVTPKITTEVGEIEEKMTGKYENVTTKDHTEPEEITTITEDEYGISESITTVSDIYATEESHVINDTTRKPKYFTGVDEGTSEYHVEEEKTTITFEEIEKNFTREMKNVTIEATYAPVEEKNITDIFELVTETSFVTDIRTDITKLHETSSSEIALSNVTVPVTIAYENVTTEVSDHTLHELITVGPAEISVSDEVTAVEVEKNITEIYEFTPSDISKIDHEENVTKSYENVTSVSFIPTPEVTFPDVPISDKDKNYTDEYDLTKYSTVPFEEQTSTTTYENVTKNETAEKEKFETRLDTEITTEYITTELETNATDEIHPDTETTRKPKYFTGEYDTLSTLAEEKTVTTEYAKTATDISVSEIYENFTIFKPLPTSEEIPLTSHSTISYYNETPVYNFTTVSTKLEVSDLTTEAFYTPSSSYDFSISVSRPQEKPDTYTPPEMTSSSVIFDTTVSTVEYESTDLPQVMEELPLTTLKELFDKIGLTKNITHAGPLTIFAPTDSAFESLNNKTLQDFFADENHTAEILLFHCAPVRISLKDVKHLISTPSLSGTPLYINTYQTKGVFGVQVNGVPLKPEEYVAGNSTIFLISQVLEPPRGDLAFIIEHRLHLETLFAHLMYSDLHTLLQDKGPFTIFAPTEDAWMRLPASLQIAFTQKPEVLREYLLGHVVRGAIFSSSFNSGNKFRSVNGKTLHIQMINNDIRINNAKILESDISATNGVVHIINAVLIPVAETVQKESEKNFSKPSFHPDDPTKIATIPWQGFRTGNAVIQDIKSIGLSKFAKLLQNSEFYHVLNSLPSYTIFAPSDEAFQNTDSYYLDVLYANPLQLWQFLKFHVINGLIYSINMTNTSLSTLNGNILKIVLLPNGEVTVNGANLIKPNQPIVNGVLHVIDNMLFLPEEPSLESQIEQRMPHLRDAVKWLQQSQRLNGGSFTFFAPSGSAWLKVASDLRKFFNYDDSWLSESLLNHICFPKLSSSQLERNVFCTTLSGKKLNFVNDGQNLFVNGSRILHKNIPCKNGIIHIIDTMFVNIPSSYSINKTLTHTNGPWNGHSHSGFRPSYPFPVGTFHPLYNDSFWKKPSIALTTNTFSKLLEMANVTEDLKKGPYTLFSPMDSAFESFPLMDVIIKDPVKLRHLVLSHIIPGKSSLFNIFIGAPPVTLSNLTLRFTTDKGSVFVNDSVILGKQDKVNDSQIFILDKVLTSPSINTIRDIIRKDEKLFTLNNLIPATNVEKILNEKGPFTLFLPVDSAFTTVTTHDLETLRKNETALHEFFFNVMLDGVYYENDLRNKSFVKTLGGTTLKIMHNGKDGFKVNNVPVIRTNFTAANGIIYYVDKILYGIETVELTTTVEPSINRRDVNILTLAEMLNLTVFANFVNYTPELQEELSRETPHTVFIPSNEAFQALPPSLFKELQADKKRLKNLLMYHMLPETLPTSKMESEKLYDTLVQGKTVRLNSYNQKHKKKWLASGSPIIRPDNHARNGVIHVIQQVMYIPWGDLVDTIDRSAILQTLTNIINTSGLKSTLKGIETYTLFAPSDEAFRELSPKLLKYMMKKPPLLRDFLWKHIVNGTYYSPSLLDRSKLSTLGNNSLYIRALADCFLVNNATILYPDVTAENGVVHVINQIL